MNLVSRGLTRDIRTSLQLIGGHRARRFAILTTAQGLTGVLDLLGILMFGVVGLMAASVSQGAAVPEQVRTIQDLLGLESLSAEALTAVLGCITAAFLLGKSLAYAYVLRRLYRFLGHAQRDVGIRLGSALLRSSPVGLENLPRARISYAVFHGTYQAVTALLGSTAILISEVTLLGLISVALLFIDPILTVVTAVYFLAVAAGVHRLFARRAEETGAARARSSVEGFQRLQESLAGQREITASGRTPAFTALVSGSVTESANAAARELFLGQLPKLLYETFMVVAAVGIVLWQVTSSDLTRAFGVLVVFLAASARLLPSLLRINAQLLNARSSAAQAQPAYEIGELLSSSSDEATPPTTHKRLDNSQAFSPYVTLEGVEFSYPGSHVPALRDVSLTIPAGSLVGIAGHSGAGKSTLADVILGISPIERGSVFVGGVPAAEASQLWPGRLAYLPQDVAIMNATIRDNVRFGIPIHEVSDDEIWAVLKQAHLAEFVDSLPDGLGTVVGDNGAKLSGGQRQRLGLARVMLTKPQLIVFDEATSALDSETELAVSRAMAGEVMASRPVTRIVIAHRLATLVSADLVVFLEAGRVRATGTFDQLRARVPAFDRQASLLGIGETAS